MDVFLFDGTMLDCIILHHRAMTCDQPPLKIIGVFCVLASTVEM